EGGPRQEDAKTSDGVTATIAGETVVLSLYPRLMSILNTTHDLAPHRRSIGWLVKRMDELYDARRRAEQASFSAEEDFLDLDSGSRRLFPFPAFAYKHFKNRHGIKHMVRSVCLDLVCNVQLYRKQWPEVEVFARFMEEFYGQKELCFFLDLRAEARRVTRIGDRPLSVGTQVVWMTLPDCVRVARGVFVDATTLYFRDIIATVKDQMATDASDPARGRISLSAFLYLAMVCFVSPKEPPEDFQEKHKPLGQQGRFATAGSSDRRLFVHDRGQNSVAGSAQDCTLVDGRTSGPGESGFAFPVSVGYFPWYNVCGYSKAHVLSSPTSSLHSPACLMLKTHSPTFLLEGVCTVVSLCLCPTPCPLLSLCDDTARAHVFPRSPTSAAAEVPSAGGSCAPVSPYIVLEELHSHPYQPSPVGGSFLPLSRISPLSRSKCSAASSPWRICPAGAQSRGSSRDGKRSDRRLPSPIDVRYERGRKRQKCDGGGNDRGKKSCSPSTPNFLEWGVNSLLSYVRRGETREEDEGGGFRPGDSNGGTALSACSRGPSSVVRPEEAPRLPPPPEPHPAPTVSSAAGIASTPDTARGAVLTTDIKTEPANRTTNNVLPNNSNNGNGSGGGGEVNIRPARQVTGGDCVPPFAASAVSEQRSNGDSLPTSAATYDGRGNIDVLNARGSRSRVVQASDSNREKKTPRVQSPLRSQPLQQRQGSSVSSGSRAPVAPPSPAWAMADPPRLAGEPPLQALSPQALLENIRRLSRSRSPSRSPMSKSQRRNEQHTATSTTPTRRRKGEEKEGGRLARGFSRAPKPTGAVSTDSSSTGRCGGDESARHLKRTVPGGERLPRAGKDGAGSNVEGDSSREKHLQLDGSLHDREGEGEFSHEVASIAADWLASFEQRFMPRLKTKRRSLLAPGYASAYTSRCLVRLLRSWHQRMLRNSASLHVPIAIIQEVFRVLALRRRDLDIVAGVSPDLLQPAVVKTFWMFEEAISTAATHSHALCNMGQLLEERRNPDEALLCFEEASTTDTGSAEALSCRARNMQRRGDLDTAAFYFEGSLARDESRCSAWYGLGQVKSAQGKHADAVEAFSREGGKGEAGLTAKVLVQLGEACLKLGQEKRAEGAYERAIAIDAGCSEAHFQLGSLLQARGGHEAEALKAFALAVK
ncbi:unnamed protein product, partial [Scytosiphon promiscuus]